MRRVAGRIFSKILHSNKGFPGDTFPYTSSLVQLMQNLYFYLEIKWSYYFLGELLTNSAIWLVLSAVRTFLSLITVTRTRCVYGNTSDFKRHSTSRKRPPKMSSGGGRLREVVAYENLDHNGSKFFLIRIWILPRLNPCANDDVMFYSCKIQFREKGPILSFEKFPFLVLARNTIMLPHLIIHSSLHYLSTGRLRDVKNKGKFYERFQIQWFDLQTFVILENWSLRRDGRNRCFDCTSLSQRPMAAFSRPRW